MRRLAIRAESWPIAGPFTISRGSKGTSIGEAERVDADPCTGPDLLACAHIHSVGHWDREVERALAGEERGWIWS